MEIESLRDKMSTQTGAIVIYADRWNYFNRKQQVRANETYGFIVVLVVVIFSR